MAPRRTSADVYELVKDEVLPRLSAVEKLAADSHGILKSSGIYNHSVEFEQFFGQQLALKQRRDAWRMVRQDVGSRLRLLHPMASRLSAGIWTIVLSVIALIVYDHIT